MSIRRIYNARRTVAQAEMVQRKTAQFNMRIDPKLKEAAERAAADDRRSLSSLIEKLLTDYCRDHGLLMPDRRPRKSR
jgi:hypothetical protein